MLLVKSRIFVGIHMEAKKTDIRSLTLASLQTHFAGMGEKPFRAKQVYAWLWEKSCTDFGAMSNLSKALREQLSEQFSINAVRVHQTQHSADGTIKNTFQLHDGHIIEGVLIPTENRMTACVSSQVGCSLSCKFCATGYLKRMRNLEAAEIYDQVVMIKELAEEHYDMPLSNIVYMGMGEPLLNYKNMMESIRHITSEKGLFMSPKRITVSTAGISKMIKKL